MDWVNATNAEFVNAEIAVASVEGHLIELWDVSSIAELSSVLGYTLPGDFVGQELGLAMSSRIWLSRLLVFSAACSLMNKNPTSGNAASEELSEVNGRFELLARLAAASAIPQGVIDRLIAGDAVSAVVGARMVTIGRLRRFLRSLPREISSLLQKTGKNGRQQRRADSPLKETKHDELLAVSRQALLDAKAVNANLTRTEAAKLFPSRYRWLTRHDSEWLAAELPSLLPSSGGVQGWFSYFDNEKERRQAYQNVVLEFLRHKPGAGRSEVYKEQRRAMTWLLQNERAWCDLHVPFQAKSQSRFEWYRGAEPLVLPEPVLKSRYRDDDERTALSKTAVLRMRALNPHLLRSELVRACSSSINWLRHRDPEWLEEHLPPTVRDPKRK
ncbi:TnsD family Tn7-like transposition protein [Variovorax paradoxus]|uniref:TnsD family Tn7-like transposition protein n=1 Tax=Variovorax paradoxus TaxID=34073 RepID=UPI0012BC4AF2|nr:TnsD family Tn7-like transposition protein [Variovorax paradoxus]